MKRIVVGYDGSETAAMAAREAAELARATGAELHVVSAVDDAAFRQGMITPADQDAARQLARGATERLLGDDDGQGGLAAMLQGVVVRTEVLSGDAARCIVDHAVAVGADLIVVGNRRVQGVSRLLGSVAVEILRHAPCSVYVAHTT